MSQEREYFKKRGLCMKKGKQLLHKLLASILAVALVLTGVVPQEMSFVKAAEREDGLILYYNFDLQNSYATEIPDGILNEKEAVTISMWVKLTTDNGYQRIWDFGTGTDKYIYLCCLMAKVIILKDMHQLSPQTDGAMKRVSRRVPTLIRTAGY